MPIERFPDPNEADEDGVVAVGGDLHPQSLLLAYRAGIFPWPISEFPLIPWFCPEERGVLEFEKLHIPKSLAKFIKKNPYRCTIDQAFGQVIEACSRVPRDAESYAQSWITPDMVDAYKVLHGMGYAHSIEVWEGTELVGGLYGVAIDGVFSGESMFHYKDNASKVALLFLIEHLSAKGAKWIDIQMITPHMKLMGAEAMPRRKFLWLLKSAQDPSKKLF